MRFLSESGTDQAYREAACRWLADPRPSRRRHICGVFLLLAMAMAVPMLITLGIGWVAARTEDVELLFAFGVAQKMGTPLSAMAFALLMAPWALRGYRPDRLMVRYHDEFKDRFGKIPMAKDSVTDGWDSLKDDSVVLRMLKWLFRRDCIVRAETDEQCVAMARRSLKRNRWLVLVFFLGAALNVLAILTILRVADFSASHLSGPVTWASFATGLVSGLFGGSLACLGIYCFMEVLMSIRSLRVVRLMLRFYDALTDEAQHNHP